MRRSHRVTRSGLAALVLTFSLAACEDEPVAATRGSGGPAAPTPPGAASAGAAAAGEPAKDDFSKLDVPEKLKRVDWNAKDDLDRDLRDTRDPFQIYLDDVRPKTEGTAEGGQENPCSGELCEADAGGLTLIAIITGTAVHKAMVVDSLGVGHMVRAGDVVGKSPYRITRITRNEVVMKPLQPAVAGQAAPQEIVKRLVSQEELQELLP